MDLDQDKPGINGKSFKIRLHREPPPPPEYSIEEIIEDEEGFTIICKPLIWQEPVKEEIINLYKYESN